MTIQTHVHPIVNSHVDKAEKVLFARGQCSNGILSSRTRSHGAVNEEIICNRRSASVKRCSVNGEAIYVLAGTNKEKESSPKGYIQGRMEPI